MLLSGQFRLGHPTRGKNKAKRALGTKLLFSLLKLLQAGSPAPWLCPHIPHIHADLPGLNYYSQELNNPAKPSLHVKAIAQDTGKGSSDEADVQGMLQRKEGHDPLKKHVSMTQSCPD